MTSDEIVHRDLNAVGLRLRSRIEACRCDACHILDTEFVVDLLADDEGGKPYLVAHRHQPDVSYRTITIRERTDRGNGDVEAAKIVRGHSLATRHIQSYARHLLWIDDKPMRDALSSLSWQSCDNHQGKRDGSDGQAFIVICPSCSDARLVDLL